MKRKEGMTHIHVGNLCHSPAVHLAIEQERKEKHSLRRSTRAAREKARVCPLRDNIQPLADATLPYPLPPL